MSDNTIIPVLLGADLNCYSVARAFHEAYGVRSYAFGRYTLGATKYSKIIDFRVVEDLYDDRVMLDTLIRFAKSHPDGAKILIGCTDAYADLIIENQKTLSEFYFCPCPDKSLAGQLISKDSFYDMCGRYGIDYPATVILESKDALHKLDSLPFSYPVIIKPASSIRYWEHPFEGMKKVYRAKTKESAEKIIDAIFSSGYDSSIIVQDLIPGDDSGMFVLTSYSDRNAKVKMMCMGHVLLEEHTPKGIGNHVAIVTEYHEDVMDRMKRFLEQIGYRGFSNFDMKYDPRDHKFKAFEINLRQGRSNHYVTHAGANLARLLVEDCRESLPKEPELVKDASFWYTVPKKIIYSYIKDENMQKTVRSLVKNGKSGSALWYRPDLLTNPMRLAYVIIHHLRYYKKYRQYP